MWNLNTLQIRYVVREEDGISQGIWMGYNFAAATLAGDVLIWDGRREFDPKSARRFNAHASLIQNLASVTETLLATVGDDAQLKLFDVQEIEF